MLALARLLSFLANPITLSFPVSSLAVIKDTHNVREALGWTLLSAVFLALIPLFIWGGVKKGVFQDFDLSRREERPLFYLFVGIVGFAYFGTIVFLHGPTTLLILGTGGALGLLLFSLVNRRIKASLHVFAVSASAIILGLLYGEWGLGALFSIPLVAWARIKTGHHTFPETLIGAVLGLIVAVSAFSFRRFFK